LVGGGLLLALALGARGVGADEGAARATARQHFERGVTLAKQHAYAEALSEFERAYAAVPHFSVLYNVAQAQIALGRSAEAVATLQRYLDEAGARIDAKRRAEVEQVLARERAKAPPPLAAPVAAPPPVVPSPAAPPPPAFEPPPATTVAEPLIDFKHPSAASRTASPQPPPDLRQAQARSARARRDRAPKASAADQRTLAYVVGAAGLALSGGAVAHYWWNRGRYHEWQRKFAAFYDDPIEPNRREANSLSDSIDRASAVTVVLAIGAGVALGTSGVLWITSRPPLPAGHGRPLEPFLNLQGTF
jgi:hypothetical protein